VKPWSLLWITEWLPCAGEEGFEKLLFVTYGLDLPEAFTKVTKTMLEYHSGSLKFDTNCPGYDMLPEGLTDDMGYKLDVSRLNLLGAFEATMTPFIAIANSYICLRQVVGLFYYNLSYIGLWPLSEKIAGMSLNEVKKKVSELTPRIQSCGNYNCPCTKTGTMASEIKNILQQKIQDAINSTSGLCLDCVKAGGKSDEKAKCRVPHDAM